MLGFFVQTCKTNSLGFFFLKKKKKHTQTPPPQKKTPTVQEAVKEGNEEEAGEGGERRKQVLLENRGDLGNETLTGRSGKTLSINSLAPVKIWLLSGGRCQLALRSDRSEPHGEGRPIKFFQEVAGCPHPVSQRWCLGIIPCRTP